MLGLQLKDRCGTPTTLQSKDVIYLRLIANFLIIDVRRNGTRLWISEAVKEVPIQLIDSEMRDEFPQMEHIANVIGGLLLFGGVKFNKDVVYPFTASFTIV